MPFDLLPHAFFTLADGSRLRYAQFEPESAARGTVLAVPGRREFIEKKFIELQPLVNRGYRLIIVEPRGQGLSTRFLSGTAYQRDHIEDFKIHMEDLRAFYAGVVAGQNGPLILHGHSMGGHLILRLLAEDKPKVAGVFLTAPMLALAGIPAHLVAHGISWLTVRLLGHPADYAPMQHDFDASDREFAHNPLTHDPARFLIIENYFTAHPELTVGGVSWAWLLAALRSMHVTHARHYLTHIEVPVLGLVGGEDRVTPAKEIAPYLNYIPRMRTHIVADSKHDILNETDAVRAEAWESIDIFLASLNAA
ncbi:MAG: alpha/beta hydrolase [Alphaproteobacteria bacterium]|nr:alpha/beta hydrolase [Alphaproteobacteria bacterium]